MNLFQRILHALGLYNPPEPAPVPTPAPIPPRVEPTPAPKPSPVIEAPRPLALEKSCPSPGVFGAVDLCQYSDQHFLDAMKYLKVGTIIRYYDWPGSPTLREKIPTSAELALIKKNGLKLLCVFQHNNSKVASFKSDRGRFDAGVALGLADKWKQPKGSAIYFGVDFDPTKEQLKGPVLDYAMEFSRIVRAAGYRVGSYGSGFTLIQLLAAGLIDFSWLSQSTAFHLSKEFAASGKWNLKQTLPKDCGGINVDFNYVNPAVPDFGQWTIP